MVLLIERPDEAAENQAQRLSRRKFYLKNGFDSANLFISGASGEMEILSCGGIPTPERYLSLQKYALGELFFRLSRIRLAAGN